METEDPTPPAEADAGLEDTMAASQAQESDAQAQESDAQADRGRSPSQQRLHDEVRGRLFQGRASAREFESGQMVAGRYRILGLLGTGGMGEVFRAHDLVLEQDVALKFLPAARAGDPEFMRRFVNEVRLARQISHPSVCRVHDIGEVDGRAYLSMEYIDGEDLASLLRRIGRLPAEKTFELAQQLCAGLAELHQAGLLHRDLKPANLMIDGQGRLKIADFGLAALRDELGVHEFGDGTPAYMAPEQLSGREVSERSDIYALGVVLYELLSGRHPHEATVGPSAERGSIDRAVPVIALGTRVSGLDDDTLEIIERCLEDAPSRRPGSVLEVAAALPGGDPIAAALRAGRAPSVDAVANVDTGVHMPGWAAWSLAGFVFGVIALYCALGPSLTWWGQASPHLAVAVLEDRARETLEVLGVEPPTGSSMQRLYYDPSYPASGAASRGRLPGSGPTPVLYEYRASPGTLARRGPAESRDDPAMTTPGEVRVTLDVRGRLRTFERVPTASDEDETTTIQDGWGPAFEAAGISQISPAEASHVPPRALDRQDAWMGLAQGVEGRVRVEVGSWRGQPVWFQADPPWAVEAGSDVRGGDASGSVGAAVSSVLLGAFLLGLGLMARRLYQRGDVDVRGAVRVSAVLGTCVTISSLLTSAVGHGSAAATTFGALKEGALIAAVGLLGYVVVEPFGRRFTPGAMVAWVRLTRARWRDPLVGRDILVGAAFGSVWTLLLLLRLLTVSSDPPLRTSLYPMMGLGPAVGTMIGAVWSGAFGVMQVYVMFLLIRWIVRRTNPAAVVFFGFWTALELLRVVDAGLSTLDWVISMSVAVCIAGILAYLIARVGLLAVTSAQVVLNLVVSFPMTWDVSGWYGGATVLALLCLVAFVGGSLYVALGRARPAERHASTSRTQA